MTNALIVGGIVAALLAFIGYAIYRAANDPHPVKMTREVRLVPYPEADSMLNSNEGWRLAPEEDYNGNGDLVYLERFVEDEPIE
jgi:hypothetical protein